MFFETDEPMVASDTDGEQDVYERTGGVTTLVSTGPGDATSTPAVASYGGTSADGTHVFFESAQQLVPGDTDTNTDAYERTGGQTLLVSTAPNPPTQTVNAQLRAVSTDGTRAIFFTRDRMVAADVDGSLDVYLRAGGQTTLLTGGSALADAQFRVRRPTSAGCCSTPSRRSSPRTPTPRATSTRQSGVRCTSSDQRDRWPAPSASSPRTGPTTRRPSSSSPTRRWCRRTRTPCATSTCDPTGRPPWCRWAPRRPPSAGATCPPTARTWSSPPTSHQRAGRRRTPARRLRQPTDRHREGRHHPGHQGRGSLPRAGRQGRAGRVRR